MQGTILETSFHSPTLGQAIRCLVYRPPGYGRSRRRYPTGYLLHGRGGCMQDWQQALPVVDELVLLGDVRPICLVMPDAPWAGGGHFYVDSQYTGTDYPAVPAETAVTQDIVRYIDDTHRTLPVPEARFVGGYSMGGAGALRLVLAHREMFSAALVLAPAAYVPLPSPLSSTRQFGAYGIGEQRFVEHRYRQLNYPAALSTFDQSRPVHIFLAVGEDDHGGDPSDPHSLRRQAATTYAALRRTAGITTVWRAYPGGHDWEVWLPALRDGLRSLAPHLHTERDDVAHA